VLTAPMHAPFAELVALASRLPPPLSVWTLEGVGYHTAAAQLGRVSSMRDVTAEARDVLSRQTLIPLHAGMGSAFAAHVLDSVRGERDTYAVDDAIARFESLCHDSADPAHLGVTLEGLGFTARGMFAELVPVIDARLKACRPALRTFFWHGVGRAIYFCPSAALPLPGLRQRQMQGVAAAAERPLDRVNAVAGFAWALTLVNLRHPFVLEPFVETLNTREIAEAFSIGVATSLQVWRLCAPNDASVHLFEAHMPANAQAVDIWRRMSESAAQPDSNCPGELFHVTEPGAIERSRATQP
jgi:hypothetical protein